MLKNQTHKTTNPTIDDIVPMRVLTFGLHVYNLLLNSLCDVILSNAYFAIVSSFLKFS